MKKKIDKPTRNKIRALYITGRYTTIQDLADEFGVSPAYIHKVKSEEKWDTFKIVTQENYIDIIGEKIGCVMDSIEYYETVQNYCKKQLENDNKEGATRRIITMGRSIEVPLSLTPQEVKTLTETFLMCDERILLLRTVKLKGEEDE